MIVLDASAAVAVLLNDQPARVAALRRRLRGEQMHAPYLLDLEVGQVLRRYWLRGAVSSQEAAHGLTLLSDVPITRHPHAPLLGRVWSLRSNLTAYDAAYVALAETLNASLITLDARIARSPGHAARVEVF